MRFLWYNCSALCGSSAWQLYVGAHGDLLQEGYATCYVSQVCCSQSPCPCGRSLLMCASAGDTQTLKGRSGSVSVGSLVLVHTRFCLSPPNVPGGYGFDSKSDFTLPNILLRLLLCPWMWGIFFWWDLTFILSMVI